MSEPKTKPFQYWTTAEEQRVRRPVDKVVEYVLNYDEETGNETVIQTLEPGYQGDGAYGHDFTEEVYVLDGTAYCATAKKWIKKGDYICRKPGMIHGPFTCKPDQGVTALLINTRTYTGKKMEPGFPRFLFEKAENGEGEAKKT